MLYKKVTTDSGLIKSVPLTQEEREIEYNKALQECYTKRKAEYPKVADYLDAQAKGDIEAMDTWNAEQLAVKAKYPKPDRADYELD